MKILVDLKDENAVFLIELLGNFSFVNEIVQLTEDKTELLKNLNESVEEVKLARQGKVKLQSANDILKSL